jgi:hypothetical protein
MIEATVRKDLREQGDRPATNAGALPAELMNSTFEAIQPDELGEFGDFYNMAIKVKGDTDQMYLVNSIDFDFDQSTRIRTKAFGFNHDDVRQKHEEMREDDKDLPETLTDKQCSDVLDYMLNKGDVSIGIGWDTVEFAIEEVI